jgi:glutamate synthase (NADPH/NADH) large chain
MEAYRHHLRDNIREFVRETGSNWGTHLLDNFEDFIGRFWLIKPKAADFNKLLSRLRDTD